MEIKQEIDSIIITSSAPKKGKTNIESKSIL